MSNLPGNYYMQKLVDEGMPKSSESLATLGLAYEQRTANLIALARLAVSIDGPSVDLRNDFEDIADRLGIDTGLGKPNEPRS